MKENKELIEEIVNKLKLKQDLPYRAGAWERFNAQYGNVAPKGASVSYWNKYLAAAALLVFGIAFSYYLLNESSIKTDNSTIISTVNKNEIGQLDIPSSEGVNSAPSVPELLDKPISEQVVKVKEKHVTKRYVLDGVDEIQHERRNALNDIALIALEPLYAKDNMAVVEVYKEKQLEKPIVRAERSDKFTLANANVVNNLQQNNNLNEKLSPKSISFGDKFDLGLFISPYSSNNNFKIGAGLTFAYNISNKLSIRTGASYNNYEVGIMKNPFEPSSVEEIKTEVPNGLESNGKLNSDMQITTLLLPNISAITGYVKSVDIPLEMKYNIGHSFYAVAGASYSTILTQERNAQYVENIYDNTFLNGFPKDQQSASTAMQTVTRTVKSNEENVKTSGFNGFLNFSIGKKMKVNNKFGLSIEPYYKVPIGEFRRSDMNYNNGGVRIMTNF